MVRAGRAAPLFFMLLSAACFKPTDVGGGGGGGGSSGGGTAAMGGGSGSTGGGTATGPVALSLQPAFLTVPVGSTAMLQVFAQQTDGTMTDVTSQATLAASPTGIVTTTPGSVTAVASGSVMLTATFQNLTATGGVQVPMAPLAGISIDPDMVSLGIGQTQALTVTGKLADDTQVDLTSTAAFSLSSPLNATIAGNVLKALAAGDLVVTATVGSFTAQSHVTVRAAKVVALTLSPSMPPLTVGGGVQLKAMAAYDDATMADVTSSATWSSSNAAVTISAIGHATGVMAGTSTITASFQGVMATLNLTVSAATLTAVSVDPVTLTLPPQAQRSFIATGHYSDGTTSDVSALATWTSSAPNVASVSNATGHQGQVTSLTAGGADIIARLGNAQGQAHLTVTPAQLMTMSITPVMPQVRPNGTTQLTVKGTYSDGSVIDLTPMASWSSSDTTVATVGNAGSGGLVTGVMVGSSMIKAQVGNIFATTALTVARQNPVSIEVAPSGISIQAGTSIALKTMAHYADGLVEDASEAATWSSSSVVNATVSNAPGQHGLVKAVANGMVTITSIIGSLQATATVTISAPTQTGLVVFPISQKIPVGTYTYLTATATYSDGSTMDVSSTATWTSSAPSVVEVQNQQGYVYALADAPGMATLTVKSGTFMATAQFTVTNASITNLQITPAGAQLQLGSLTQMQAIGVFSDLTTQDETYSVSWTSSDPSIATVADDYYEKGYLTANAPGTVTITANFMGVIGTTTLTVTPATLMSIQVTPFAPKLPKGYDTYLRATGIYSDNTTQELTYLVSWTSGAQATAAISPYGELSPLQAGVAQINATYLGVTGSTAVTVTNATLTSISVTPGMASLAVGAQQPFTATGTFSDATTMDVTPYVTWLSSNHTAADVANAYPYNGQAKGLATGTSTITAIRGSVTGSAAVSVH
jgi:trimeric autotransporter adhesin